MRILILLACLLPVTAHAAEWAERLGTVKASAHRSETVYAADAWYLIQEKRDGYYLWGRTYMPAECIRHPYDDPITGTVVPCEEVPKENDAAIVAYKPGWSVMKPIREGGWRLQFQPKDEESRRRLSIDAPLSEACKGNTRWIGCNMAYNRFDFTLSARAGDETFWSEREVFKDTYPEWFVLIPRGDQTLMAVERVRSATSGYLRMVDLIRLDGKWQRMGKPQYIEP